MSVCVCVRARMLGQVAELQKRTWEDLLCSAVICSSEASRVDDSILIWVLVGSGHPGPGTFSKNHEGDKCQLQRVPLRNKKHMFLDSLFEFKFHSGWCVSNKKVLVLTILSPVFPWVSEVASTTVNVLYCQIFLDVLKLSFHPKGSEAITLESLELPAPLHNIWSYADTVLSHDVEQSKYMHSHSGIQEKFSDTELMEQHILSMATTQFETPYCFFLHEIEGRDCRDWYLCNPQIATATALFRFQKAKSLALAELAVEASHPSPVPLVLQQSMKLARKKCIF